MRLRPATRQDDAAAAVHDHPLGQQPSQPHRLTDACHHLLQHVFQAVVQVVAVHR